MKKSDTVSARGQHAPAHCLRTGVEPRDAVASVVEHADPVALAGPREVALEGRRAGVRPTDRVAVARERELDRRSADAPGPQLVESAIELGIVRTGWLIRGDSEADEALEQHLSREGRLNDIRSVEAIHAVCPGDAVLAAEALRVGRPEEVDLAELILQLRRQARDVLEGHPAGLIVKVPGAVAERISCSVRHFAASATLKQRRA